MTGDADKVAEAVERQTVANPGNRALIETAQHWLEARHVAYLVHRWPGWTGDDPFLLATYPQRWIDRYRSGNLKAIDPTATESVRSATPIDWLAVHQRGPGVAACFREAADQGVGPVGITFPVSGPVGYAGALTFTFSMSKAQWPEFKARRYVDMQALATVCHTILVESDGRDGRPDAQLSRREIECLGWASEGKTNQDISTILGLKETTVRMFLDSARTKMNCLNKAHLITKAFRQGLIS
jgi:DNA-binding CsgD family transcriptional regulator